MPQGGDRARFLAFGFVTAFLSSFGQTYFLGAYKPVLSAELGFDNAGFGFFYLMVTLGSAVGLNQLGHVIDRVPLPRYMTGLVCLLAASGLFMALSGSIVTVFAAMLCLRLLGQGMMTHAAMTSMSRYFSRARGRAVATAALGMPLGQALLPPLAVWLMMRLSWRESWAVFAAAIVLVGLPVILWLLKGHARRHEAWQAAETAANAAAGSGVPSLRRRDMLRDPRFYLILPSLFVTPFWVTVVFFFAEDVAAAKGLSLQAFTGLYWIYGLGAASVPLIAGYLADRFGGVRLLPVYPPLLATALLFAALSGSHAGLALFLALLGMGAGLAVPVNNAVWAELYGTRYLGEIKSLITSLAVVATALSPFLIGLALDRGVSIQTLLLFGVGHGYLSVLLLPFARLGAVLRR